MTPIDAFIDNALTETDTPITEVISSVREAVDSAIMASDDIIPILLGSGLCYYDVEDRTWYARVRVSVMDRLYELALHGFVSLTKETVRWIG